MAGVVGIEPTTRRLTVVGSAAELHSKKNKVAFFVVKRMVGYNLDSINGVYHRKVGVAKHPRIHSYIVTSSFIIDTLY